LPTRPILNRLVIDGALLAILLDSSNHIHIK